MKIEKSGHNAAASSPSAPQELCNPAILAAGVSCSVGPSLGAFYGIRYANPSLARLTNRVNADDEELNQSTASTIKAADLYSVLNLSWPTDASAVPGMVQEWLVENLLVQDDTHNLYLYEYSVEGRTVRGWIGELLAEPLGAGPVIPHEGVFEAVVYEFASRFAQTRLDAEPVILVQETGSTARALQDRLVQTRPIIDLEKTGHERHRLWRLSSPEDISTLSRVIAARPAVIADGHHRYASHVTSPENPAGPGTVLAMVVDKDAHALQIRPIHRIIPNLAFEKVTRLLESSDWVGSTERLRCSPELAQMLLGGCPDRTFMVGARHDWLVCRPADMDLSVVHLHGSFLPAIGMPEHLLLYRESWQLAVKAADQTDGLAVILKPPSVDEVLDLARRGKRLPQKATSFGPKPPLSVVLRSFWGNSAQ